MERLFTIGAYGFEAESFFDALQAAEIDLFLDIRRRRGYYVQISEVLAGWQKE